MVREIFRETGGETGGEDGGARLNLMRWHALMREWRGSDGGLNSKEARLTSGSSVSMWEHDITAGSNRSFEEWLRPLVEGAPCTYRGEG